MARYVRETWNGLGAFPFAPSSDAALATQNIQAQAASMDEGIAQHNEMVTARKAAEAARQAEINASLRERNKIERDAAVLANAKRQVKEAGYEFDSIGKPPPPPPPVVVSPPPEEKPMGMLLGGLVVVGVGIYFIFRRKK